MCGRFTLIQSDAEVVEEVHADDALFEWQPRYSIAPTNVAPIVIDTLAGEVRRRVFGPAGWDFPRSQFSQVRGPSINAKIENLTSTWAAPFASRRCAVPMSGYYEWTGPEGHKQPHFLHGDGLLFAAGMYARVDGEPRPRFVIVTREARDASGEVHDRMPAFLTPELLKVWLDPRSFTPPNRQKAVVEEHRARKEATLHSLYASSEKIASGIREHLVDPKVNNVKTVDPFDPTLVDPLTTA